MTHSPQVPELAEPLGNPPGDAERAGRHADQHHQRVQPERRQPDDNHREDGPDAAEEDERADGHGRAVEQHEVGAPAAGVAPADAPPDVALEVAFEVLAVDRPVLDLLLELLDALLQVVEFCLGRRVGPGPEVGRLAPVGAGVGIGRLGVVRLAVALVLALVGVVRVPTRAVSPVAARVVVPVWAFVVTPVVFVAPVGAFVAALVAVYLLRNSPETFLSFRKLRPEPERDDSDEFE